MKACTHKIGQALKKRYRREMDYVYAVISEIDRKLDRQVRDLDDVRLVMETLKKIREQEVCRLLNVRISIIGGAATSNLIRFTQKIDFYRFLLRLYPTQVAAG